MMGASSDSSNSGSEVGQGGKILLTTNMDYISGPYKRAAAEGFLELWKYSKVVKVKINCKGGTIPESMVLETEDGRGTLLLFPILRHSFTE